MLITVCCGCYSVYSQVTVPNTQTKVKTVNSILYYNKRIGFRQALDLDSRKEGAWQYQSAKYTYNLTAIFSSRASRFYFKPILVRDYQTALKFLWLFLNGEGQRDGSILEGKRDTLLV